jgi:hypothetical protein
MEAIYPISIPEMCEHYKKLYTGAIGDILDKRGYRHQILPYYIKPIRNDMIVVPFSGSFQDLRNMLNFVGGLFDLFRFLQTWNLFYFFF